ncbi:pescadillo-family BRCT domain-containing protein [Schizosaccharomyces japonicus yFS275]|uniref:Pescadillo homolog n=1 Tax=Schizosaccharomyces japonicus (strain yFS275 / FY16936) TaxID=402676 RepID=B6JWV7_SCHJY|nr:pescadillo-family BRCT domain-containing protein [Schizosaccharomyces japonicus yFS275]EEB05858.1 pescadillo-family BRCT domain-containing protein [Schizosaccharomyces japonicus yFS275]
MARVKQKGKSGAARNFITRNQALKKLQLTLADFRRICILKGIYPREPRNKKKANKGSTAPVTFYYTKDIQYLLHEPIVEKFREYKTFAKKLSKVLGKGELHEAKRLEKKKPSYTLDHIIKERYPTFHDALNDLSDALSMLFLFANMPVTDKVGAATVANCERLCAEFQHYVIASHSLRKSFLSIKGIYYQASILGEDITWIVPYKFAQHVPSDVDFRIMLTFLELYQTLVGFVNFKLYSSINLNYPPKLNISKDQSAAGLSAYETEVKSALPAPAHADKAAKKRVGTLSGKLDSIVADEKKHATDEHIQQIDHEETEDAETVTLDEFKPIDEEPSTSDVSSSVKQSDVNVKLFSPFTFFLSREVPRYSLEFLIRAFGGKVGWDPVLGAGSPFSEDDTVITHHISDRPRLRSKYEGRVYIQPQWVYDSINRGELVRTDEYAPGATLPPHLSPFVKYDEHTYNPEEDVSSAEEEEDEEVQDAVEEKEPETKQLPAAEEPAAAEASEDENEAEQHQRELEAEAAGVSYSEYVKKNSDATSSKKKGKKRGRDALTVEQKEQKEAKELAKIMMSNKQKKLYKKMQYSNAKKEELKENLKKKKRAIEKRKKAKTEN